MAAPLIGKLWDETGDHLTPSHTQRHGRRYVYYVSNRLLAGGTDPTGWRLPADALHQVLRRTLAHRFEAAATEHRLLANPDASRAAAVAIKGKALADRCKDGSDPLCFDLIATIALQQGAMEIALSPEPLVASLGIPVTDIAPSLLHLTTAFARKRRGVETRLISGQTEPSPDATLIRILAKAHRWSRELREGASLIGIAQRDSATRACDAAQPFPSWTDTKPVPVLMTFLTGIAVTTITLALGFAGFNFPAFGAFTSHSISLPAWAGTGIVFLFASILAAAQRKTGWWLLLLASLALGTALFMSFQQSSAAGFTEAAEARTGGSLNAALIAAGAILPVIFILLMSRKSFDLRQDDHEHDHGDA